MYFQQHKKKSVNTSPHKNKSQINYLLLTSFSLTERTKPKDKKHSSLPKPPHPPQKLNDLLLTLFHCSCQCCCLIPATINVQRQSKAQVFRIDIFCRNTKLIITKQCKQHRMFTCLNSTRAIQISKSTKKCNQVK